MVARILKAMLLLRLPSLPLPQVTLA